MRTRFEAKGPWTRAHEKFALAWGRLIMARASAGEVLSSETTAPERWLYVRWRVRRMRQLTAAQARLASRQVNAWRASLEGYTSTYTEYPRQWRRNRRRALAARATELANRAVDAAADAYASRILNGPPARSTARMPGAEFQKLIEGTALEALGRLVPSDSTGKF